MLQTTRRARPLRLAGDLRARLAVWRLTAVLRMPRWLGELVLLGALYGVYEASRGLERSELDDAVASGGDILHWEHGWHLSPEHSLNQLLVHSTPLAVVCSYYYAALHYVVTPLVLVWVYRRHARHYWLARTSLVFSTALGLVGFYLLPTAPPRLLPGSGIRDTLADVHRWGWWSGAGSVPRGLAGLSNQFAAMPSLHVGWALWCGVLLVCCGRRTWLRILGGLYPLGTAFVVLATGNHYLLDVLAGVVTMAIGTGLALLVQRRRPRPPDDAPTAAAGFELSPRAAVCRATS